MALDTGLYIAAQGPAAAASAAANAPPPMASTNPKVGGLGGNSTFWLIAILGIALGYIVFSVKIGR